MVEKPLALARAAVFREAHLRLGLVSTQNLRCQYSTIVKNRASLAR